MRMPFRRTRPAPAAVVTLCIALVTVLAGCASKNPLMEEPAPSASAGENGTGAAPAQQAAHQLPQQAAAKPAEIPADAPLPTAAENVTITAPTGLRKVLGIFSPYRIDIQQGNFVSREMVEQLKENMQRKEGVTRDQVRFVMGTPLLTDIFHADRWDYVFHLKKSNGGTISSRVTVFFDKNRLTRIDGGLLPTEKEYLALIAGAAPGANKPEAGK